MLITADKDFGEIVFRKNRLVSDGIVLIRLAGLMPEKTAEAVSDIISERGAELPRHFSVISPEKVRIPSK